jgi:hypothetical protein
MTRTWSVSGRRMMWGQVSGRRGRSRGRWKPLLAAPLVGILFASNGCSSSGSGDADVEDAAAASSVDADVAVEVPVTTEDGRMLQPAGHVGIWFETEPRDPLDRLVWKSQQFVGQPLELEPLGDAARTPDSVDLPNVCAPEVFERLETLGIMRGQQPDVGSGYVLCAARGASREPLIRHVEIFWGSDTSPDHFLGEDGVSSLDESGVEVVNEGGFSEISGCIPFGRPKNRDGVMFSWSGDADRTGGCDQAILGYQIINNSIGGYLVSS